MLYLPYGLSDSCFQFYLKIKITILNETFFFVPHPFLFPFCPSFSISLSSIVSIFRLRSVFLPVPFSPSLSFHYIHSTSAQLSLFLLTAHSTPSFLSFHPIPVFSILVPISKSLSLALSLPRYSGVSSVIHLSYSLLYLDSLILSPLALFLACLCLCPFCS
jgi:hypothetical protein